MVAATWWGVSPAGKAPTATGATPSDETPTATGATPSGKAPTATGATPSDETPTSTTGANPLNAASATTAAFAAGSVLGAGTAIAATEAGVAVAAAMLGPVAWLTLGCAHDPTATTSVEDMSVRPTDVDVARSIDAALGRSAATEELAARAVVLPHTVKNDALTWNCWEQLLTSPTTGPMPGQMSIASLMELGVIAEADATSVVGQNGRRFHLCPVLRQPGSCGGAALEWVGMHAVPV